MTSDLSVISRTFKPDDRGIKKQIITNPAIGISIINVHTRIALIMCTPKPNRRTVLDNAYLISVSGR